MIVVRRAHWQSELIPQADSKIRLRVGKFRGRFDVPTSDLYQTLVYLDPHFPGVHSREVYRGDRLLV